MRLTARVTDSAGNTVTGSVDIGTATTGVRTFAGDTTLGGHQTIPAGETWEFDPNVSTTLTLDAGSLIVSGTLRMRPAHAGVVHTLRFANINETAFAGGGHDILPDDIGLWVDGGLLDLQGTPRTGWNRTGTDPTWLPGDEVMVAPNKPGDYTFRPFIPGSPVPTSTAADGKIQPTEVFNLTRNVRLEGTPGKRAHVMLGGSVHTLRHVALRYMGPRTKPDADKNTTVILGRYPLHWHHSADGPRGTVVEGVVVRDSSRAFVPHASNGITLHDCVAYNITEDAYWWDPNHPTDDTTWDHCAAFNVWNDPTYRGLISGFVLGEGIGNKVTDCVSVVTRGNYTANGFMWPEFANLSPNVWESNHLVSHNHPGMGIFVWQNDHNDHVVEDTITYSNGQSGIWHGAYINNYTWRRVRSWGNTKGDVRHSAFAPKEHPQSQVWDDIYAETFCVGEHHEINTPAATRLTVVTNLKARKLLVDEGARGGSGTYELRCAPGFDLSPTDVTVLLRRSTIKVVRSDGSSFNVP